MARVQVWFNDDTKKLYDDLVKAGLTTEDFPLFIHGAFHHKVIRVRLSARFAKK